jgi:hypothetical protein
METRIWIAKAFLGDPTQRVGNVMIDSLVRLLPAAMDTKLNGLPSAVLNHAPSPGECGLMIAP